MSNDAASTPPSTTRKTVRVEHPEPGLAGPTRSRGTSTSTADAAVRAKSMIGAVGACDRQRRPWCPRGYGRRIVILATGADGADVPTAFVASTVNV